MKEKRILQFAGHSQHSDTFKLSKHSTPITVTLLFYKQLSCRNSPFCLVLPHSLVLQGSSLEMPKMNLEVISLILCRHESVKEWHVKETKALDQQFEAHMLCYAETTCLQVLGNLLHFLHSH